MTPSGEGLGLGHFQGCQVSGRLNLFYKIWADFFSFIFRRPVFLSFWMENHWKTLKINKKGWTRDIWLNIQLSIRLGSSNSTLIHQFYYSALTWLRSPTFSIRLNNESPVGTPLRRYLLSVINDLYNCLNWLQIVIIIFVSNQDKNFEALTLVLSVKKWLLCNKWKLLAISI